VESVCTILVPEEEYNIAVLVGLGGHSLVLFDAANTPLSGVSTTCRGRIEYQNVSVTRHLDIKFYEHTTKFAEAWGT